LTLAPAFAEHRRFLWDLSYRLTGCAADADDVVQETFARAAQRPPSREGDLRPWLSRVAVNLGRDLLRRRRRAGYVGPWLPSPVETGDAASPDASPEARYDLVESASFAFLLALEALTPRQRAALLLRDVFDLSVREAAEALQVSEGNVKVLHHRARRAMEEYHRTRRRPTRAEQEKVAAALQRFAASLAARDIAGAAAALAPDVVLVTDAAGEFHAALKPIHGRERVMRFYVSLAEKRGWGGTWSSAMLNGVPALVGAVPATRPREVGRFATLVEVDDNGLIRAIHGVLATRKLSAVPFEGHPAS